MFEREIKFIYDFNVNQVKKLGTSFTFNSLLNVNLHPAILKYISAEIDYLIYEDRKRLIENSNFDYTGEDINKYFILINKEIRKGKKLSLEYIDQLIIHSTSFTVNFLVQPKWALTKLVFEKENSLSVQEVLQILKYLHYYSHLRELLEKFLVRKKIVTVEKPEFENLIDKIYAQLFDVYSEKTLDNVIGSFADFFNVGAINKSKIPLSAIDLFLKERKLDKYLEKLNNAFPDEIKQNYGIVELKKILYSETPVQTKSYMEKVLTREEPEAYSSEEKQTENVEKEGIAEIPENLFSETNITGQLKNETEKTITINEESPEINLVTDDESADDIKNNLIESEDNEIKTNEVKIEEVQLQPGTNKTDEKIVFTEETLNIENISKAENEIQKTEAAETIFEFPENADVKNEILPNEKENIVEEKFPEFKILEQDEPVDQLFRQEITVVEKELPNLPATGDDGNIEELIVDQESGLKDDQIKNELTISSEENDTEIIFEDDKGESNKTEIPSPGHSEELNRIPLTDQSKETEFVEKKILPEELTPTQIEEIDFQSLFDNEEFLVLGEDTLNISFDDLEVEKLLEPESVSVDDKKTDEFNPGLINEINNEIEIEPERDTNLPNEDNKEILFNNKLEETSDNFKSEVIEEIDKEISNLSDSRENENINEEIINMEEREDEIIKNPDRETEEIMSVPGLMVEKDDIELPVLELQKEPVKLEKDISYFFKGKNIDKIISSIFDNDAEDFAHTFDTLSECRDLQEAITILNGLFRSNHIKLTSKEASLMTDIINEYFNQ